jgi:hypothetical protein
MKLLDNDETTCKEHAFAAHDDAEEQHKRYWSTHTKANQDVALKLKALCYAAYFGSRVYLTAREKFITVKVEKPSVSAARLYPTEMSALGAYTKKIGIEPVASKISLLFRITK